MVSKVLQNYLPGPEARIIERKEKRKIDKNGLWVRSGIMNHLFGCYYSHLKWVRTHVCYLQNEEIPRFQNKLKVIITSGLRRFISSKEIIPCSQFYFFPMHSVYTDTGTSNSR